MLYLGLMESYTASNNTATFTYNPNNCDSVTLDLIINNSGNIQTTACDERIWDGQTYTESGSIILYIQC